MATHEELVGTYESTRYRNEQQNFLVGFLESGETVCGPADERLEHGITYRFFGLWKQSKYGRQFQFKVFTSHEPLNREGVVNYLEKMLRGTGIGKVAAAKIWDMYGSDSVRVLRTQPKAVSEALGIAVEKCHAAADRLTEHAKTEDSLVEVLGLFAGRGFPMSAAKEIVNRWGSKAPGIIQQDPYRLMTARFPGCGFARCDGLYLSLGLDPAKLKRQTICMTYEMSRGGNGDTWFTVESVVEDLRKKIAGAELDPKRAIKLGKRAGWISTRRDDEGRLWLSPTTHAKAEQSVADIVARLMKSNQSWPLEDKHLSALSDHQREELLKATAGTVGILSGTPGTGKTYTAASVLRSILANPSMGAVAVVALAGKAAVRATESLAAQGISIQATTIHRALVTNRSGHGDGNWGFVHNERNPLPYRFVLVDESSMVDVSLLWSLLRALQPGTRVLFIGDPNQLPPVGHGAPLRDLIAAGLPHGSLKEVKRNSGLIVDACSAIRQGRRIPSCDRFDDTGNNLRFVSVGSPVGVVETVRSVYESVKRKGARDPIEDIQILVAMNEQGILGRKKLNTILQSILNADGHAATGNPFRVGDKVICTSNGFYPSEADPKLPEFLANGDIGRVLAVSDQISTIKFPSVGDGPRIVRIPIKTEYGKSFDLAYAITCHKSQGSEWPVVIIIADDTVNRSCSREWWYTAISRAKDRCLIIGKPSTVDRQSRRILLDSRKTFLVELLMEEFGRCDSKDATPDPLQTIESMPSDQPILSEI
ncbi:MAG: hypothetical protein EB060_09590 [Proteobacteria bacterium]|nr:hypothetical protein [Pseudomonadota bacterium]